MSSRLFHLDDFVGQLPFSDDEAFLIAKFANKYIDERSVVLYGNQHEDNSCTNFTSHDHRNENDTHVGRMIEISTMGSEPRHTVPIKDDSKVTDRDLLRAEKGHSKRLEEKIKALELHREKR